MSQTNFFEGAEREDFMRRLKAGEEDLKCPCCRRKAKIWRLHIHSTLAAMLLSLYSKSWELHGMPDAYVHVEAFKPPTRTGNDFSIVKHWGLAESKPAAENEDKISSGMWRLTDKGFLWVKRKTSIDKYANVFDDKCLSYAGPNITIMDALGSKFSYEALIGNAPR